MFLALLLSPLSLRCLYRFPDSFVRFLYSSPASLLVYFCCFSCRLWSHTSRTSFVTQGQIFFLFLPMIFSAVDTSPSFRPFARVSSSLSRTQRAANFPATLAWNTSTISGSLSFSRSNRMRGLFVKRLVFSCNFIVVSTRSRSLPMSAPRKMCLLCYSRLEAVRCQDEVCLVPYPLGACQVAVLDNLWGWRVLRSGRVGRNWAQ